MTTADVAEAPAVAPAAAPGVAFSYRYAFVLPDERIAAVVAADGKLVRSAIDGDDAGSAISESQSRSAELRAQLARIEQRLAARGLGDDERAELQRQAEAIRAQLSNERNARSADEERLANTPMTFDYAGDEGFRFGNAPFGNALDTAWSSFTTMVSLVLLVVGAMLPWAALAALLLFAWRSRPVRWLRRVLVGRDSTVTASPVEQ